jgi:osmotically inducible protein OsmC
MKRNASAVWQGGVHDGSGRITTESGVLSGARYGVASRFESEAGTNPEELIAAAHAGCFATALSNGLEAAQLTAESIAVKATVSVQKLAADWTVTEIHLEVTAKIPGADSSRFMTAANHAKSCCPISRLLGAAAKITMDARLA